MGLFKINIEKLAAKKNVKGLIKALKNKDFLIQRAAIVALGNIDDKSITNHLIEKMEDVKVSKKRDPMNRYDIVTDETKFLRMAAAEALGKIGDDSAIKSLVIRLADSNKEVRELAQESLKKINPKWKQSDEFKKTAGPLIEVINEFNKGNKNDGMGEEIDSYYSIPDVVYLLEKIGDKRAIEPLKKMLDSGIYYSNQSVSECANNALKKIDPSFKKKDKS